MNQSIIPGFEIFSSEPIEVINYLNEKGFHWLSDYNSGNLLTKFNKQGPYIPYRIQFPSGKILDEEEIFQDISKLEKMGFSKDEIFNARILYEAINHEDTPKDLYKFCNDSFVSEKDEIYTLKRYSKIPFCLEK
jgi:hypothetical protein